MAKQEQEFKVQLPDNYSPPDWSIGDLYNKAWFIIKKNKVLWIFGVAVATLGSGSFSNLGKIGNFGSSSPTPSPMPTLEPTALVPQTTRILGNSTSAGISDYFSYLFSQIPLSILVVLGIELFIIILFTWALGIISHSWSTGSLLSAIEQAIKGEKPTIREASKVGLGKIKPMAWISIVPGLLWLLATAVALGILMAGFAISGDLLKIFFGALIFIALLASLYVYFYLSLASIWAQRKIITETISGKSALWAGYRISKKKKWSMLLLGIVNGILGGFVFGVPILVIIVIAIGAVAGGSSLNLNPTSPITFSLILTVVILFMGIIFAYLLGNGIFTAFKAVVWSLAYKKIKGKYEDGK